MQVLPVQVLPVQVLPVQVLLEPVPPEQVLLALLGPVPPELLLEAQPPGQGPVLALGRIRSR